MRFYRRFKTRLLNEVMVAMTHCAENPENLVCGLSSRQYVSPETGLADARVSSCLLDFGCGMFCTHSPLLDFSFGACSQLHCFSTQLQMSDQKQPPVDKQDPTQSAFDGLVSYPLVGQPTPRDLVPAAVLRTPAPTCVEQNAISPSIRDLLDILVKHQHAVFYCFHTFYTACSGDHIGAEGTGRLWLL